MILSITTKQGNIWYASTIELVDNGEELRIHNKETEEYVSVLAEQVESIDLLDWTDEMMQD